MNFCQFPEIFYGIFHEFFFFFFSFLEFTYKNVKLKKKFKF